MKQKKQNIAKKVSYGVRAKGSDYSVTLWLSQIKITPREKVRSIKNSP